MLRVGVIGARTRRQGLGFHLARFAAGAGADVVGIVGTTEETRRLAVKALSARGIHTRSYAGIDRLLAAEHPNVLVIASPAHVHEEGLGHALEAGVHVLCEKPFVWGGPDPGARAKAIQEAFLAKDLHLGVNTQWPFTLPTYRRLFPEALGSDRPPRTFQMELAPDAAGPDLLPDALPHALSLLAAACPAPAGSRVVAPVVREVTADGSAAHVGFRYVAGAADVAVDVSLRRGRRQPRPAAYGFDGFLARRHVELEGYRLFFDGPEARIPVPDPLPLLVGAFLGRVSSGAPPSPDPNVWPATAHLETIAAAWPAAAAGRREAGNP